MDRLSLIGLKDSLSTRLLKVVFSFYFLVAFVMTMLHIAYEYHRTEETITDNLVVFNQTFNSSIANSVWNLDQKQLNAALTGILSLPDISGVMFVPTNEAEERVALGQAETWQPEDEASLFEVGNKIVFREFPVYYTSDDGVDRWEVGKLTLFFNSENVWRRIQGSLGVILASAILKTIALSFFFIMAFRRHLAEPLSTFTQRLDNLKLHDLQQTIEPLQMKQMSAEIRFMDTAFLNMIQRVREFAEENNRLNANLFDLNQELENRVYLRTQQLYETQRKLLREAHMAGMNQVTTEILHNVGNIVNSVGLSIDAMKDSFTEDEFKQFGEVMRVLEQKVQRRDLVGLEAIIEFVRVFGAKTQRDMNSLKQVLDSLEKFVVHLRRITEVQKLQLTDTPYEAEIDLNLFIQDSIYLAGLTGQEEVQVEVHPNARQINHFVSDEHRLMQIMVNLLVNAKQAVLAVNIPERKITISARTMGQSLMISVEDNGCGIKKEHMRNVFQAGFTTKSGGNGLGLHNSANQVKYLGGEIDVFSYGELQGAIFTIRIPYRSSTKVA